MDAISSLPSNSKKRKMTNQMKPPCKLTCRSRCRDFISETKRDKLFIEYQELDGTLARYNFHRKNVLKEEKQRCRSRKVASATRRMYTFKYSFESQAVCQTMYCNTLGISKKVVYSALNKRVTNSADGKVQSTSELPCPDRQTHEKAVQTE